MKTILVILAAATGLGLLTTQEAEAGGRVSWSVTIGGSSCGPSYHGGYGGGYYHRGPVYHRAPRVHYYRPPCRPVYVAPPCYVPQRPVYRCRPYRPHCGY